MARTISIAALLPASAAELYGMYVDGKTHSAITGAPAVVAARAGSPFSAFGGMLRGTMLHVVPGRLIVQSWRSSGWKKSDADSTLVIAFVAQGKKTRVELTHVNVPDDDFGGVSNGWEQYYFAPWREYLAKRTQAPDAKGRKR